MRLGPRRLAIALVAASLAVAAAVLLLVPPIAQWPEYHDFADRRSWLGLPHFGNVVSNLPFSLVGLLGLVWLRKRGVRAFTDQREAPAWYVFFLGLLALGPASAWYHLAPDNAALMLDRLAMSLVFMAWLAIHLGERLSPRLGLRLLPLLVLLGCLAVLYWYASEQAGRGDLRPWGYVQFWPMLVVLALLRLAPARYSGRWAVPGVYVCYAAALLAEWLDHEIYALTWLVSGHTVKHLLAALGAAIALGWLMRRQALKSRQEDE